ncbi:hypothetical protein E1A91_A02G124600v1 [Gossypium mustelinum]|uniref:Uncharacterized protein n=3 Tax=Gossypium TaxID=3633 RepID=A0A5D3AAD7_GOSMU|nr:hypothetical protein ES288_A02G132400v1 [Gossypium darwinii]TYI40002.1 hypothetical protein ES332_A02G134000v1 [Gossypium tomentosum]TYJ46485.1 hypothetical protein E1A91_A02G124600v1 [Gossypium mustelinum]TYH28290.1 hypothetical protein ES288_A02G132400v1 [Gossypium darwinii]TYI40003.1 hypothetical protein ES332_A02G134000v1 [Gossypium tomentosum]
MSANGFSFITTIDFQGCTVGRQRKKREGELFFFWYPNVRRGEAKSWRGKPLLHV